MTKAPLVLGDVITLKADEEANEVFIEVRPSENPAKPDEPTSRAWWKPW